MNTSRCVRIKVRGRLSERLATVFEGMTLVHRAGESELIGEVADQAQLHGLLSLVRDLGLELDSVTTGEGGNAVASRGSETFGAASIGEVGQ
jgi:hypothetical protein